MKSEASWAVYVNGSLVVSGDCLIDRWGGRWVYNYVSRTPNSHGMADLVVSTDAGVEHEFAVGPGYDYVFPGAVVKRLEATEEEYILRLLEPPRTFGEAVL